MDPAKAEFTPCMDRGLMGHEITPDMRRQFVEASVSMYKLYKRHRKTDACADLINPEYCGDVCCHKCQDKAEASRRIREIERSSSKVDRDLGAGLGGSVSDFTKANSRVMAEQALRQAMNEWDERDRQQAGTEYVGVRDFSR